MSTYKQLLLFEAPIEEELFREIKELRESINKLRKSQFGKTGELDKKYDSLSKEIEEIKHIIKKLKIEEKPTCEFIEFALI